jgi:hypothetical protein
MKARWLLEAFGVALLLMLPYFAPLIMPGDVTIYHHYLNLTNIIDALLLDLAGAFLLAAILLAFLHRLAPLPRKIAGACLAGLLIWRTVGIAISLCSTGYSAAIKDFSETQHHPILLIVAFWSRFSHLLAITIPLLLVAIAWMKPDTARHIVRAVRLSLAAFSFCALWIIPQLLYFAYGLNGSPSFDHSSSQLQSKSSQRIVWMVFDELSYDLTFDHPPSGQQFPQFENLHSSSTNFSDIQPSGVFTERIIPSLLAGHEIDQIRSTKYGNLVIFDNERQQWVAYDPNQTLIGLAKDNGWNPGIVGWFNPYCRIFADVLTACSWTPGIQRLLSIEKAGASEDKSVLADSLVIPRSFLNRFLSRTNTTGADLLKQNIRDYNSIMGQARNLIRNGQIHFVFVHLPVPHPPGIYNRDTHKLCECGNYLDNLTLADDTLGVLLQQINQTPWAGQTTVIVSSDHSWRIPLWKPRREWTPEEEAISRGHFDERPVFLVHFPGQKSSQDVVTPVPELKEHDIIASMLQGKIKNPDDLNTVLASAGVK